MEQTGPTSPTTNKENKPVSTAYLPYTQTTFGRLSRMLAKHNIKSVALPHRKISSYLPPFKEAIGLRIPGIYRIPCECGIVYIGQSGRTIQHRIKEHSRHIKLDQPNKSAVAEHIASTLTTKSDFKIPNFSPLNLDTWTSSSGRPLNWIYIPTT